MAQDDQAILSEALSASINEQIGHEFAASFQYIAMAAYCEGEGLSQLAAFFYRQANEERDHAMRFVKYIVDTGGKLALPATPAPKTDFAHVEEVASLALSWEREVTRQINQLMKLAVEEDDYITQNYLNWFVNEQLEEIATMDNLLKVIRLAKNNLLYVEEYIASHGIASPSSAGPTSA